MTRLISLLNEKNHYLEKFFSINESEMARFNEGNFDSVEDFYAKRERILEIIRYIDIEVDRLDIANLDILSMASETKSEIREALMIKDQYVNEIIAQDLEILACIEAAKSNIIMELQETRKSKRAVGQYRARSFNRRLDEEA
jgi:hypothetical protein